MASLPSQMVLSLVDACIDAGLDRESLLAVVSPEIAAGIPTGDTQAKQLLHAWCHLNQLVWPGDCPHPIKEVLETGRLLARTHSAADTFRVALEHLSEPATLDNSKDRAFYAHFTRRTKETYLSYGCRVTPTIDDPPGPFMVEHPDRRTSMVAVFHREGEKGPNVGMAIAAVQQWLHTARSGGEDAEGYIVLAPFAQKSDRDQVLRAQLHPIDYREQRLVSLDTIERVVRCIVGAQPSAEETGFWIVQGGEARSADDALAAFLRDFQTSVWLLVQPRHSDMGTFVRGLFHAAARSFLRHGPPAPLLLGVDWRTRRTAECACEVFVRHGVPMAPFKLEPALKEGVICPIAVYETFEPTPSVRDPSPIPRLVEGMSQCSKALIVFSPDELSAARHMESSLRSAGYRSRLVRALADAT
jgi:hypothetical protein